MKTLGLDIGTTSISAVVYDTEIGVLNAVSVRNDSFLAGESWERIQNPLAIRKTAEELIQSLIAEHCDISAIGVTGQMHGIVYLDQLGDPVSPLFTWQDGRGDLPFKNAKSWASHLSELTGYSLPTGYGMVTHFYNLNHQCIPQNATVFCTIQDYIAMTLAGRTAPVIDVTNAASLGLFQIQNSEFDIRTLEAAGINRRMLPEIAQSPYLGIGPLGIPVYTAIGDNQASFLGAVGKNMDAVLINIGTGGQISVYSPACIQTDTLETRPFPGAGWLLVGASLCGGRSYALLERFFRETVKMVTGDEIDAYSSMTQLLDTVPAPTNLPVAHTTFQGTRKNPEKRGAFSNIHEGNFTPLHFIYSVMQGMADELFSYYRGYLEKGGSNPKHLIGSGNGLRKNKHLCRVFEETFGCKMTLSQNDEEAACGAAMYAATHCE